MDEWRASSWGELQEMLYRDSWRERLGRFRSPYAFRGVTRAANSLTTTLSRLGHGSRELEGHILRNFRKYAHADEVSGNSVWGWLAVAQHHGLPTRLLDWTYSPYVALHFATERPDEEEAPAVVWMVNYIRLNETLPARLKDILADEGANTFSADMLGRAAGSLREFDRLAPSPFLVFFEPPSLDARIVNQFALFSLLSDPMLSLEEWLAEHGDAVRKLVIPARLKWEVRDKLDQANITERVLFPGLDGLGRWLTRYYTPRPGHGNRSTAE